METIFALSVTLLSGLLMSRITKIWNLPAVTAYLIAGVLIGPYCLGAFGVKGLGFVSADDVAQYAIISDVALGFIAFAMGNEFRLSDLKKTGKKAVVVAVFQAVVATAAVDVALFILHLIMPDKLPLSAVLTLGAIAAATAPAATLMVIKQYKAEGPVTKMLLPVVALDDLVGLVIFAVSFGAAKALESGNAVGVVSLLVNPLIEVVGSVVLGGIVGVCLHFVERYFHSRSKRLSISVCFVLLAVALSKIEFSLGEVEIGFSPLIVCMMMGTLFCNLCKFSEELMERVDRWTGPLMVAFFVISGAGLEFKVFSDWVIVLAGVVFILVRSAGKIVGANVSSRFMRCEPTVRKYLGITLLPQAGVSLGMSLTAMSLGNGSGLIIRNIALFAVLIYELIGPLLTKIALDKAGEIPAKPVPPRLQADLDAKAAAAVSSGGENPAPQPDLPPLKSCAPSAPSASSVADDSSASPSVAPAPPDRETGNGGEKTVK